LLLAGAVEVLTLRSDQIQLFINRKPWTKRRGQQGVKGVRSDKKFEDHWIRASFAATWFKKPFAHFLATFEFVCMLT